MEDYERSLLQDPFPVDLVKIGLSNRTSILCVAKHNSKVFVAFKIVQETQRKFPGKISLIVTQDTWDCFSQQFIEAVKLQTSLKCTISTNETLNHDSNIADILIASPPCIAHLIKTGTISWSKINLIIINDCHLITHADHHLKVIMDYVKSHDHIDRPITVGLSSQLPVTSPSQLESMLSGMESVFGCNCSVSGDLVAMDRYGEKSKEDTVSYSLENKTEGVAHLISSQIDSILEYVIEKDKGNSESSKPSQAILSHISMLCNTCIDILRRFGASAAEYNIKIIIRELTKMGKKAAGSEDIAVLDHCKEILSLIQKGFCDKNQDCCEMTQLVKDLISRLWIGNTESKVSDNKDTHSLNETCSSKSPLLSYIEMCEKNSKRSPVIVILCISDYEAAALNFLLNKLAKLDPELSCIKSAYLSSSNIRQSETCQDTEEVQSQAIIQLINKGEVNVLVLSCEVEKDIYMSLCKQLLRFGIPKDYPSYVKIKRILRSANAEVIFFEEDEKFKESSIQQYKVLKEMENVLSKRCEPFKSAVMGEACWEKFTNASKSDGKPQLKDDSRLAIPLINRYCSSFPNDGLGCSQPHHKIRVTEQEETFHVESTIYFPSHSCIYWPFQELVVVPKENATQRLLAEARSESCVAAAMLACNTLLETGELEKQGPKLTPNDYSFKKANASCAYEVADGCNGAEGSTKRKRAYERNRPSILMNNLPVLEMSCYVYSISIRATQKQENESTQTYVGSNMLGLLSRNQLPKIPKFIIYKKATELLVSITECGQYMAMTAMELAITRRFHSFIHNEIMRINGDSEDECFLFEPESQTFGCYVVPLEAMEQGDQESEEIFIGKKRQDLSLEKLNLEDNKDEVDTIVSLNEDAKSERKRMCSLNPVQSSRTVAFEFLWNIEHELGDLSNPKDPPPQLNTDYESYRGRIVTAVYMNKPTKYLVIDILYDLNPLSPFPDLEVASTFSDYFKKRYGLDVKDEQPLLEVKNLNRVNSCLVSKYRDSKGHERPLPSKESKRRKNSQVLLIPELCSIHPLPSSLWQDVLFIPPILYRLESILVSEELRQIIAMHSGVGSIDWPETVDIPLLTGNEGSGEDYVGRPLKDDLMLRADDEMLQDQGDQAECDIHKKPSSVMEVQSLSGHSNGSELGTKSLEDGGLSSVLMTKALTEQSNDLEHSGSYLENSSEEQQHIASESYPRNEILNQGKMEMDFSSTLTPQPAVTKQADHVNAVLNISEVKDNSANHNLNSTESFSRMESEMNEPSSTLILKGLTCISAVDVFNHDRLEMYGDAFIKFAVSLNMYCETPLLNVGKLSFFRGLNISNRQLFYLGRALNIPSYIINTPFQPFVTWCPHGFKRALCSDVCFTLNPDTNEGDSSDNDDDIYQESNPTLPPQDLQVEIDGQTHVIASDKSVADTTEAIIGAYLVTSGAKGALEVMKWLGMGITDHLNSDDTSMSLTKKSLHIPSEDQLCSEVSLLEAEFKNVEASIGYSFRNKQLLYQAFIHVTYPRDLSRLCSSYEQLEFLGDALLDYLVTRHLYFTYKDMSPGCLTDVRSAIVNSYSFAFLSVQLGLHKHLRSFSLAVFRVVNRFTAILKDTIKKKMVANPNQVLSSVFVPPDDSDENNDGIEVPKILADIFESVVAAVFVDTGMDVERTWLIVYKLLKTTFDHYEDHPPCSPIRQLKEMFTNDVNFTSCEQTITGRYSCHVSVKGFGKFKGTGRSLKIARSTAAQRALAHIEEKQQQKQK